MIQSPFEVYSKFTNKGDFHRAKFQVEGPYRHRIKVPCDHIKATIGAGRHVDVGTGTAVAVEYLRSIGVNAEGVEPEETAFLYHHGLPVRRGTIYDLDPTERWDGLSMFDVFEHLQWPEKALRIASSVTTRIWITTPELRPSPDKYGPKLRSHHHLREWTAPMLDDFVLGCIGWRPFWKEIHNETIYVAYGAQ